MINNYTEGKIFKPLLLFTIPLFMTIFIQSLYGSVDLFMVGKFNSSVEVSAVVSGGQVMLVLQSIIVGLTMGSTILLNRVIGEDKKEKIPEIIGTTFSIFMILSVIITFLLIFNLDFLAKLVNVPLDAYSSTISYVRICGIGVIFIVLYNVISSIFRGLGNSKLPLLLVIIACIINIILDYVFVAIFDLKSDGTAYATVIAQAFASLAGLIVLAKEKLFRLKDLNFNLFNLKWIFKLGTPVALQDGLNQLSFLIIIALVNSFGLHASSGVGVAEKCIFFLLMIPIAYMNSASAIVSQNYGANKKKRVNKVFKYSLISSVLMTLPLFLFTVIRPDLVVGIFTHDAEDIRLGAMFLQITACEAMIISMSFPLVGLFNGLGHTKFVLIQGLIVTFVFRIPLAYLFTNLENTNLRVVALATPIAASAGLIMCTIYYFKIRKRYLA